MIEKIVLATGNIHKIEEMKALLYPIGIETLSTLDFPELQEVDEDGHTLEENALKKARYVNSVIKLPALSDDTGLEVEALNGEPGVYSARYAGEKATFEDNLNKLIAEMEGKENRKARFRTIVALVSEYEVQLFEGICSGHIIKTPKGVKGFGYDPVFVPEGYDKTFAELAPDEKNKISHRGKAIQKFIRFLQK